MSTRESPRTGEAQNWPIPPTVTPSTSWALRSRRAFRPSRDDSYRMASMHASFNTQEEEEEDPFAAACSEGREETAWQWDFRVSLIHSWARLAMCITDKRWHDAAMEEGCR